MSQKDSSSIHAAPPELPDGPPELPQQQRHATVFTGKTSEFFGIWIINVVLGILTLGMGKGTYRALLLFKYKNRWLTI